MSQSHDQGPELPKNLDIFLLDDPNIDYSDGQSEGVGFTIGEGVTGKEVLDTFAFVHPDVETQDDCVVSMLRFGIAYKGLPSEILYRDSLTDKDPADYDLNDLLANRCGPDADAERKRALLARAIDDGVFTGENFRLKMPKLTTGGEASEMEALTRQFRDLGEL